MDSGPRFRRAGLYIGAIYPQPPMSSQYIFTMYKLSRTHPPDKQVLKDISLSFLPVSYTHLTLPTKRIV